MPYLTLWDKISQNLAHLEANFHKIFKSQNFQTILQHILWRNEHKSHFVVFITSFLHINTGFWLLLESSKVIFVKISQNFIKSHIKFCLISQFQSTVYGMYVHSDLPCNIHWLNNAPKCKHSDGGVLSFIVPLRTRSCRLDFGLISSKRLE